MRESGSTNTRKGGALRTSIGMGLALALCVASGCSDDQGTGTTTHAAKPPPKTTPAPTPPSPPTAPTPAEPEVDTRTPEELIEAGRGAYNGNCIACHAMDPRQDGALGPAVAGASFELIEARVMRGEYPEGYEPKRPSRVMVPLPHLERRLPELAAYLGSLE